MKKSTKNGMRISRRCDALAVSRGHWHSICLIRRHPRQPGGLQMRAALALIVVLALAAAKAQEWPQRPVTIVVPFAAGGSADLLARILQQHMQAKFGIPFVVENRS